MFTRATSAIALVVCLVMSPIALAREADQAKSKDGEKQAVKQQDVKKADSKAKSDRGSAWHGKDWKSGAAPSVRAVPFRPSTQPAAQTARTVVARPDNPFIFTTPARYDYFSDHYGSSGAKSAPNVLGYVAPAPNSPNTGNPFIYRRP